MTNAEDINNQVNSLLATDKKTQQGNAQLFSRMMPQLGQNIADLAESGVPGNLELISSLTDQIQLNAETYETVQNHNASYHTLYELLNISYPKVTPSLRVTYQLLMIYFITHYFNLHSTTHTIDYTALVQKNIQVSCKPDQTVDETHLKPLTEYVFSISMDVKAAKSKFHTMLSFLLNNQIKQNYLQMYQDAVLRIQYVLGSFYTLNQVVQQQNTSIELLTQLSEYVNEQVTEYSTVYEQLSTLIATQERKITFQTDDMQTLEGWQYWCKVGFWGLVVFFVLMVIVDHMMDISQFTSDMDGRLKRAASAAGQATQALVGSR